MMLAYKRLEQSGAIGPMMKVGSDGKPLFDPSGELPGTLVPRPREEYPKAVVRYRTKIVDGVEVSEKVTLVAHSKSEELKMIAEEPEAGEAPRSPLERERDELAQKLADQSALNSKLEEQLRQLAASVDALRTAQATPVKETIEVKETITVREAPKSASAISSAEKRAITGQK